MNNLTIIHTYYNEKTLLEIQLERWNVYNTPINIILIDDGSQKVPATEVLRGHSFSPNINFSLYRVTEDIGFNSHGCRNLGARLAASDWLVFLDVDYTIQPMDLKKLQTESLDLNCWYEMNARYKGQGRQYMALNQFIIPRKMFLESGGYDESWVPYHMGDRELLEKLEKNYAKQNFEWLTLTCRRGGRKPIFTDTEIPIYDDEKMVFYTRPFDPTKIERIETKINFDWVRVI